MPGLKWASCRRASIDFGCVFVSGQYRRSFPWTALRRLFCCPWHGQPPKSVHEEGTLVNANLPFRVCSCTTQNVAGSSSFTMLSSAMICMIYKNKIYFSPLMGLFMYQKTSQLFINLVFHLHIVKNRFELHFFYIFFYIQCIHFGRYTFSPYLTNAIE